MFWGLVDKFRGKKKLNMNLLLCHKILFKNVDIEQIGRNYDLRD